jgi:predicted amidophosphoribosyltransferase
MRSSRPSGDTPTPAGQRGPGDRGAPKVAGAPGIAPAAAAAAAAAAAPGAARDPGAAGAVRWRALARQSFARASRALADFALPRHCVVCGGAVDRGRVDVCCGRCWAGLARLGDPQCSRCGHPLVVGDLPPPYDPGPRRCRWCDLLPPYLRAGRSVCWVPGGAGGALAHALKYDGWTLAAAGMARRMAALPWPRDVLDERAALVPVPLSAARLRERGYNQSLALAAALAPAWGLPVWDDVLVRTARPARKRG